MKELISILERFCRPRGSAELLEKLVRHAEHSGASDVHIQMRQPDAEIAFRLDGVMTAPWSLTAELAERVCGRIKFLARLKTYQESLPQDGRIDKSAFGTANDIRVATYPTVTGEKIVLRIFGESRVRELGELELPPDAGRDSGRVSRARRWNAAAHRACGKRQNHHHLRLPAASRKVRRPAHHHRGGPGRADYPGHHAD